MKPITKLNTYAFTISTTIVYYIWLKLSYVFVDSIIISTILTFIISISFYRIIYKIGLFLCEKISMARRVVLGKYYFEGVWIGFYIYDNSPTLYYEIFDQSIENITVIGRGFDLNGQYKGCWTIIEPHIDLEDSKFSYHYEMNEPNEYSITLGYGIANIIWDNKNKAQQMDGFAVDGNDTTKQWFFSIKTKLKKKDIMIENSIYNTNLIEMAKKFYENNH